MGLEEGTVRGARLGIEQGKVVVNSRADGGGRKGTLGGNRSGSHRKTRPA